MLNLANLENISLDQLKSILRLVDNGKKLYRGDFENLLKYFDSNVNNLAKMRKLDSDFLKELFKSNVNTKDINKNSNATKRHDLGDSKNGRLVNILTHKSDVVITLMDKIVFHIINNEKSKNIAKVGHIKIENMTKKSNKQLNLLNYMNLLAVVTGNNLHTEHGHNTILSHKRQNKIKEEDTGLIELIERNFTFHIAPNDKTSIREMHDKPYNTKTVYNMRDMFRFKMINKPIKTGINSLNIADANEKKGVDSNNVYLYDYKNTGSKTKNNTKLLDHANLLVKTNKSTTVDVKPILFKDKILSFNISKRGAFKLSNEHMSEDNKNNDVQAKSLIDSKKSGGDNFNVRSMNVEIIEINNPKINDNNIVKLIEFTNRKTQLSKLIPIKLHLKTSDMDNDKALSLDGNTIFSNDPTHSTYPFNGLVKENPQNNIVNLNSFLKTVETDNKNSFGSKSIFNDINYTLNFGNYNTYSINTPTFDAINKLAEDINKIPNAKLPLTHSITIKLEPPNLGVLHIKLKMDANRNINLIFKTYNEDVANILNNHTLNIKDFLLSQGINVNGLNIVLSANNNQQGSFNFQQQNNFNFNNQQQAFNFSHSGFKHQNSNLPNGYYNQRNSSNTSSNNGEFFRHGVEQTKEHDIYRYGVNIVV